MHVAKNFLRKCVRDFAELYRNLAKKICQKLALFFANGNFSLCWEDCRREGLPTKVEAHGAGEPGA